jgi:hypothetical protein
MDFELIVRVISSVLIIASTIVLIVYNRILLKRINEKVTQINAMLDEMRVIDNRHFNKKDTLN